MKKALLIVGVLAVVGGAGWWAAHARRTTDHPASFLLRQGTLRESVSAAGTVEAWQRVSLSFPVGGRLASLRVARGQRVRSGQVLATLHAARFREAAAQAAAGLARAQAELAQLTAGPTAQQLARDQAQLAAAKTALAGAQTAYTDAQAAYRQGMQAAQRQVAVARADLTQAQTAYASASQQAKEANLQLALAEEAYPPTALPVIQAHQAYDQAAAAAAQAQAQVTDAQEALTQAQTAVNDPVRLKSALDQAAAGLAGAQKAYLQAQAGYALETAPATAQAVAAARAAVDQAAAAYRQASHALAQTSITAPFAGVVASAPFQVGEVVGPGATVVSLVGGKALKVVAQVDEDRIAMVHPGQPTQITTEDLPGAVFAGKVFRIAPQAQTVQGVNRFPVQVTVANPGSLRAGMTVRVAFLASATQALYAPKRYVLHHHHLRGVCLANSPGFLLVRTGLQQGDYVQLVSPELKAGERLLPPGACRPRW